MICKTVINRTAVALTLLLLSVAVQAAASQYRVEVGGLACPFCAYGIEKKLHDVPGVDQVETQIKAGAIIVTMADGAALDEATVRQAVRDAGFTLRGFKAIASPDEHE